MERYGLQLWSRLQFAALRSRKSPEVMLLLQDIHRQKRTLMTAFESYIIYSVSRAQSRLEGAFAEVGVFRGGSARILCETKGDKPLHLFDTFEGLPPSAQQDRNIHRQGQYSCSLAEVQDYLKSYPNVHFHPGIFPQSSKDTPEQTYAFVHFDVDLYEGTKACLEYFYPRMTTGGIMLSHDYDILAGVSQAFHEFLTDKPEALIEQPTTQCMVVKR